MEQKPKLLKGVSFDPTRRIKKFKAVIRLDGKLMALGYHRTEQDAHDAYINALASHRAGKTNS